MHNNKLIFLQLNEINFQVIKNYVNKYELTNFKKILSDIYITNSENEYHLLEPWIQWVTINSGLLANDHKVFRLGDIIEKDFPQIYELLEKNNYKVGAISPMNARNNLLHPCYFIPDPWTETIPDSSFFSKKISKVLNQLVNDNSSGKITFFSMFFLIVIFFRFSRIKNYFLYFEYFITYKFSKWKKALFLDLLLHDIHISLIKKHNPDYSTLFLNAGAHIQHHYFFSSKEFDNNKIFNPNWYIKKDKDPLVDFIKLYDRIIGEYLNLGGYDFLMATGLSQTPNDDIVFYYRLKDHKNFFDILKIDYKNIYPRMTRDFLIEFENSQIALDAEKIIDSIKSEDGTKIFGLIDNRGVTLFITLDYPKEIKKNFKIFINKTAIFLYDHISFVAIKNGKHNQQGFFYTNSLKIKKLLNSKEFNIKNIFKFILNYFR